MADGERGAVLVVDDDRDWRDLVVLALRCDGIPAVTAGDGAEALRALRRGARPQAIILDLSMPRLTGWEFREAQLRDAALREIPVVVVSGDEPGGVEAQRYLRKPCTPEALLAAVRGVLPTARCAA